MRCQCKKLICNRYLSGLGLFFLVGNMKNDEWDHPHIILYNSKKKIPTTVPNVYWLERDVGFECVFNGNYQLNLNYPLPSPESGLSWLFFQSFQKHYSLWQLDSSWSGEDINFLGVFWETILTVLNVPRRIQDLLSFSFHSVLSTRSSILDGDVL